MKSTIPDCCICTLIQSLVLIACAHGPWLVGLFSVTIRQALFIAPCSHTFHYKCIRPLLETHHPAFSCPLCRTYADLDEDVEVEPEPEATGKTKTNGLVDGDDDSAQEGPHPSVAAPGGVDVMASPKTPVVQPASLVVFQAERDAGAETEVEADGRGRSPRLGVPVDRVVSGGMDIGVLAGEDDDEDMVDLTHAQTHGLGLVHSEELQMQMPGALEDGRDLLLAMGRPAARGDSSEGEGRGGRNPTADEGVAVDELGGAMDDDVDGDGTIGGKRKR
jgi:hypothetical protein